MEITWSIYNNAGAPITGGAASTSLKIRRGADGYLLDWADMTFKNAAWGTLATTLSEVDAPNLAGDYKKAITVSAWDDGFYQAILGYSSGVVVRNGTGEFYLKDGLEVEAGVAAIKAKTDNLPASPAAVGSVMGKSPADVIDWKGAAAPAMTGDAFARLGSAGAGLTTLGDTRIAALDVAVSTRSTLTAQQVWEYANRTLSSYGTLVADIATAVWGAGTKVLTSFGTLVADTAAAVWGPGTKALTDKAGFTISGAKQTLDALQDATQGATALELAAAQSAITNAITTLNNATQGATKTELDLAQIAIEEAMPVVTGLAVEGNVQGHVADALAAYDPPTRGEAIVDKEAVIAAIDDITLNVTVEPVQVFEGLAVTLAPTQLKVSVDGAAIAKANLKVGEAKDLFLLVRDRNKNPIDLSAATLEFGVKKSKTDLTYTIQKADLSFDKSQATIGIVAVHLLEIDTDNLIEFDYIGELRMSWDGETTIMKSADIIISVKLAVTN